MASEMSDFTKNQILSQAGVAMISQANSQSQLALQLLG
jgi:flagellin